MESLVVERVSDLSTGDRPRSVKKMSVADFAVVCVVCVVGGVKSLVVKRYAAAVRVEDNAATVSGGMRSVYIATKAETNIIIDDKCWVMTVPSATSGQKS